MRIRSAWEIALEKTADIELDEEKYKADTLLKEGMTLAGKFLNDTEFSFDSLKSSYREELRDGVISVIFSNISLPTDDMYQLRFDRNTELVSLVDKSNQAVSFMGQIKTFLGQYMEARKQFSERMKEQIKQARKENPEQLNSSQYSQMIEQKLKQMETQYKDALEDSKNTLKEMLG